MIIHNYDHYFPMGVMRAEEVTSMLVRNRHPFAVHVYEDSPLRYILVYTDDAAKDVRALLEVI